VKLGRPYKLRRLLGKIVHESDSFIVSKTVMGDRLEVIEKSSRRILAASPPQQKHLQHCLRALRSMNVETQPGSRPFEMLVEDFASAVFRSGLRLERAFFSTSPRSRAYSAVVRTQIDGVGAGSADPEDADWEPRC